MVSRKTKEQATQYVCDKLEDSGLYTVQRMDHQHVLVKETQDVRAEPRTICVVIPNFLGPVTEYEEFFSRNQANNVYTSPVFFKDGKTAFVRMVERNRSWRTDKSLKGYNLAQINSMLHLRRIEKNVTGSFGNHVIYYQPRTERLKESLREFILEEVILDYSHIEPDEQAYDFVYNRPSVDYKLPIETDRLEPAARFLFYRNSPGLKAKLTVADVSIV